MKKGVAYLLIILVGGGLGYGCYTSFAQTKVLLTYVSGIRDYRLDGYTMGTPISPNLANPATYKIIVEIRNDLPGSSSTAKLMITALTSSSGGEVVWEKIFSLGKHSKVWFKEATYLLIRIHEGNYFGSIIKVYAVTILPILLSIAATVIFPIIAMILNRSTKTVPRVKVKNLAEQKRVCPVCRKITPPKELFCPKCGLRLDQYEKLRK